MPMFGSAARKPELDLDGFLQSLSAPSPQTAPRTGMFGGSPNPGAAPPAVAAMRAEREPLNMGMAPPDELMGTQPIGMQALAQQIPTDPRVAKATAPGLFGKGGKGWQIMGIVGDALSTAGGGKATYMPAMLEQRQQEQEHGRWQAERDANRQKLLWQMKKDSRPEIRSVNNQVVSVPFEGGDPSVIYTAPTDEEQYAANLGLKPGDEGYAEAIMDAKLRSYGPTAYGQRQELEEQRYDNRVALKGVPTYANLNPRTGGGGGRGNGGAPRPPSSVSAAVAPLIAKLAAGQTLTPTEQQALAYYRGGGRGGGKPPLPIAPAPSPAGPRSGNRPGGPVRVSSPAEARALKPGTQFMTPDGQVKVR